tara:strand:- start:510 stop:1088 length:579 start_codon:yes stop_codon:yes gene_type:complete
LLLTCTLAAVAIAATPARLIRDINGNPYVRDVDSELVAVRGNLYMAARNDDAMGNELWTLSPDGSLTLVADLNPGPASGHPAHFAELNGRLYFSAQLSELVGTELVAMNLTTSAITLVADLCAGPCSGSPKYMTRLGDELYFQADDGANGPELWVLNASGHVSIAHQFKSAAGQGGSPAFLVAVNGTLFMAA